MARGCRADPLLRRRRAGQKAAFRAVETVLPHLTAGHSVAFAFLPDGLDPDDLMRQQGPEAMEAKLAEARPLVDVLWQREWAGGAWTTPERRAQLEAQLRQLVGRIHDASVRSHYERDIRQRFNAAFGITERVAPAPVPSSRPVAPSRPTFADEPSPGHFAPFDASEHPAADFDPFDQFDSGQSYEPRPPALMKRETSPRGRPMQGHGPQTSTNQPSKPGFQQDRRNGQGFRGGGPAPRNGGSYPAKRRWPPTPSTPSRKRSQAPLFAPAGLLTWKRPACPCGKPCFCGPSSIIPGSSRTTRNNSLSCRSPHLRFPGYAMASFRCRPLTIHLTARRCAPN